MKSLTHVIDDEIAAFIRIHQRKPVVIRLGSVHVQTLYACGPIPRPRDQTLCYDGIPIQVAPERLHVSVG